MVLKPPQPHPSSPTSSSLTSIRSGMAHPDHPWLQTVLDHTQCPSFIRSMDSSMSPYFVTGGGNMPKNVQQVVQLLSSTRNTSLYIGIDSNGDLQVAKKAPAVIVHSQLSCPGTGTLSPALIPPFLIVSLRDDPTHSHSVHSALSLTGVVLTTCSALTVWQCWFGSY